MGVGIYVKGLIPVAADTNTSVRLSSYNWGVRYARGICRHFGWQTLPWKEPGQGEVFARSAGYGRLQNFLRRMRDDSPFIVNPDTLEPFPHLLHMSLDNTVYIPVDFPNPFFVEAPDDEELADSPIAPLYPIKYHKRLIDGEERLFNYLDEGDFVVGSTVQLSIELHKLKGFYNSLVEQGLEIGGIASAYNIFADAAQESLERNLPFFVRY